ncbi:DUF397 domain-containing protein [Streptomyces sp. NBC_00378]|uniref:DUF397 domain-containing protein n=1 Tax=unclassified Streptomyces TaxID=2593676 RepID=UPI002253C1B4|nr:MULTISPECIES: DUF397 domain-containing protein [unclassified Streptomyces]MCX5109178.1 DUF397 domain-containing protein [Streptomyces sp. NBC_00378]
MKSSFSDAGGNNCVEVAAAEGTGIATRESESQEHIVITNPAALHALVLAVKADNAGLS